MAEPERVADAAWRRCAAAVPPAGDGEAPHRHRRAAIPVRGACCSFVGHGGAADAGTDRFSHPCPQGLARGPQPPRESEHPAASIRDVTRLAAERPDLVVEINGGIRTLDEVQEHLAHVDAVMLGRAAYDTPWIFARADTRIYGAPSIRRPPATTSSAR